jgi:glycosyltransferase involved in cell wall biosynthesis
MSNPSRPVVLFTNSMVMGGMEEHVLQLARGLRQRGLQVAVICSPQAEIQPLREALSVAGVIVHALPERGRGALGALKRFGALVRTLRRYPDCVLHLHFTGYRGGDLLVLAARLARVHGIVRTAHMPPVGNVTRRDRMLIDVRDRFLTRVICPSERTRLDHVEGLGRDPRKLVVVHNAVDLGRFVLAEADASVYVEIGLDPGALIVGTVSRLGEVRKGMAQFVDMAAEVARTRPEVHFVIVGEGELRDALENQAQHLGVSERIHFLGARTDIPRLMAAMRVFVMPSLFESGPITVLEALAMARPVVSTPVGLVPEVIERDGCGGRLVPAGDSSALARAVLDVLADEASARRLGECGRQKVVSDFSVDGMVSRIEQIYREAA